MTQAALALNSDSTVDIAIGYGDNSPIPCWKMSFDISACHFELVLTYRGVSQTLTTTAGDLKLSTVDNSVSWPMTVAQSSSYPPGGYVLYRFRRVEPNGEVRTYARGRLIVTMNAIDTTVDVIPVAASSVSEDRVEEISFIKSVVFG